MNETQLDPSTATCRDCGHRLYWHDPDGCARAECGCFEFQAVEEPADSEARDD